MVSSNSEKVPPGSRRCRTTNICVCVFICAGLDFRKLSQLSQLLQGTDVSLPPRLLQCTSPSVQQEEFLTTVEALQAKGRYSQARQVAQLAGLSIQGLLLSQVTLRLFLPPSEFAPPLPVIVATM